MKNRDKWITIAFLVFILVIPLVTVARNVLPHQQGEGLSEAEKAVLEQNGTLTGDKTTQTVGTAGDETGQSRLVKEPGFVRLQKSIDSFTDGLFGRTKLIAFNTGLTSLLTGGTYIESTQTLKGKNNMFFYKTELDGKPIWDYMGINHFTEEEMAAIAANLTATREHLGAKGIEFYTMCI
ncbi:MAG: hypothetical protein K2H91_09965, partial [Lachnospiraceae bacterium]|nr:hypothetical protein [Lachnospiraceae bacterium]